MSTSGSAFSQQAELTKSQRDGRAITLWTAGMVCIFGWEYLICLPKEIQYVWRRKFSLYSALYVANRYIGLILGAVAIWVMEISNSGPQAQTCKKIFRWQPVGAMLSTLLSQAIMANRVYALFGLCKIVLGVLTTIMAAEFAIEVYTLTIVTPTPGPPGVAVPCVAIAPYGWLVAFWALPLVFDTVTFMLTLLKTYLFWKQEIRMPTMTLIFRDGIIYFAAIFSMNLINVILFTTQDASLQAINLPATTLLNVIMSCRLVLNLRKPHDVARLTGGASFFAAADDWTIPRTPPSDSHDFSPTKPQSDDSALKTESYV